MKRILVITVLAVLLMSTAGASVAMAEGPAKTALSCEPPALPPTSGDDQFGVHGILTYGTSSEPVKDRLITVYTSLDEKKWTEVGSTQTGPDGTYTVQTSQDIYGPHYYKAVFAGDKVFQKVTSPTIAVTCPPVARSYHTTISHFGLLNQGWFVVKLAFLYSTDGGVTWKESEHTGGIVMSEDVKVNIRGYGVPSDALVRIHVIVVGGPDRTGSEVWQHYWPTDILDDQGMTAYYSISGTTFNPRLDYEQYGS